MNRDNLNLVLEQYVHRFDELSARDNYDESYKWRAEPWFKCLQTKICKVFWSMFRCHIPVQERSRPFLVKKNEENR